MGRILAAAEGSGPWGMVPAELGGYEERGNAERGREGTSQGHRMVHGAGGSARMSLAVLKKHLHDDPAMQFFFWRNQARRVRVAVQPGVFPHAGNAGFGPRLDFFGFLTIQVGPTEAETGFFKSSFFDVLAFGWLLWGLIRWEMDPESSKSTCMASQDQGLGRKLFGVVF